MNVAPVTWNLLSWVLYCKVVVCHACPVQAIGCVYLGPLSAQDKYHLVIKNELQTRVVGVFKLPTTPSLPSPLPSYVSNPFKLIDYCFIFLGIHCETDINECNLTALPCHNGGTCVDGIDGYTCQCSPGFSGPYCNVTVTKCDGSPCQNGATCVENILR